MPRPNKMCKVCGKKYHYCPTCAADSTKPRWMTMFDCDDCRIIFDIATKFNLNKITKEEAQNALSTVDLNKDFSEVIQKDLDNIFYIEPAPIVEEITVEQDEPIKKSKKSKKSTRVETIDENVDITVEEI